MLIRLKAFGGKLQSDVWEVPALHGDRLNVPYFDPYPKWWDTTTIPDVLTARHLVFEYRGEREILHDGKQVLVLHLVDW